MSIPPYSLNAEPRARHAWMCTLKNVGVKMIFQVYINFRKVCVKRIVKVFPREGAFTPFVPEKGLKPLFDA